MCPSIVQSPFDHSPQEGLEREKYVVLQCLGAGGFGSAYRVLNKNDNKEYVMKLIRCKNMEQAQKTLLEMVRVVSPMSVSTLPCLIRASRVPLNAT